MDNYIEKQLVQRHDVNLYIRSMDEIDIYVEIFKLETYKPHTLEDLVVVDIGMNVGLASLYFSRLENIKKIYGYEPFKFTYDCAVENISVNPSLKDKIIPFNFGFSNEDKIVEGYINPDLKGNSSTVRPPKDGDNVEFVQLKKASTIVKEVLSENPDIKLFIKMDCEGGESEIFKDNEFVEQLNNIFEIVIETHNKDIHSKIKKILENKGFYVSDKALTQSNGYLHAYR